SPPSAPPAVWPETLRANRSLDRALNSLSDLLRTPDMQKALEGALVSLTSVRAQISQVADLKRLHDWLHRLEIETYRPMVDLLRQQSGAYTVDRVFEDADLAMSSIVFDLERVL